MLDPRFRFARNTAIVAHKSTASVSVGGRRPAGRGHPFGKRRQELGIGETSQSPAELGLLPNGRGVARMGGSNPTSSYSMFRCSVMQMTCVPFRSDESGHAPQKWKGDEICQKCFMVFPVWTVGALLLRCFKRTDIRHYGNGIMTSHRSCEAKNTSKSLPFENGSRYVLPAMNDQRIPPYCDANIHM